MPNDQMSDLMLNDPAAPSDKKASGAVHLMGNLVSASVKRQIKAKICPSSVIDTICYRTQNAIT
jgi:hypothetical protein